MMRLEFQAMGSRMLAVVDSPNPQAQQAVQAVPGWFEEWEQVLSRFRPDSELSRLNRSNERAVPVSLTLWEVFHASRQAELASAGLVRATVLDALLQAGYDRPFEQLQELDRPASVTTGRAIAELAAVVGWEADTHSLYLAAGTHLDFGGLAKGWAAEKAARQLAPFGPALVDAGGDIAVSGPRPGGQHWPIGVQDPFIAAGYFETLLIEQGGVATSGRDYHRWQQGGRWNHHIIDPRSGLPADSDLLTVTVIAAHTLQAETAAKTILILGSTAGMDWLEAQESLAGLLVLQSGEKRYSQRLENYLIKVPA